MAHEIHKVSVRNKLAPRREPYWAAPIARGKFIGFRKIDSESGTWIARLRDDAGRQQYKSLGYASESFDYDKAKAEAEAWFKNRDVGITDDVVTVADACRAYVEDLKQANRKDTAHDAEGRFKRTVYKTSFGDIHLTKFRTKHLKDWRASLTGSAASVNRNCNTVIAALNLAARNRYVSADRAQEWTGFTPLAVTNKRRTIYLDLDQRRAWIASAAGAVRDLIEAAVLTGARPGELVKAKRSQFDARTELMTFVGKTGERTVFLSKPAVALFKRLAKDKLPSASLLTRDDGKSWAHSDWDLLVKEAATKAGLPKGVVLYTARHSFITAAITGGMATLEVARIVGTSLQMIEKHYGHLVESARDRLNAVRMV